MQDDSTSDAPARALTWRQISKSITASGLRRSRDTWSALATYLRKAIRRDDWTEAAIHGQTPPHEEALAAVLVVQDFFRRCAGKSVLPYYEPEDKPARPASQAKAATDDTFGYVGGPDYTNGGVSGAGAVHEVTTRKNEKAPYGVHAFSGVEKIGGSALLAWYYCASGFELGLSSNTDAQVQVKYTGTNPSSIDGPTDIAIKAAGRQTAIRQALRKLTPPQRGILETAYQDRRCATRDVTKYDHGAALLVARVRGETVETYAYRAVGAMQRGLIASCARRSRKGKVRLPRVRDWNPLSRREAKELLKGAHEAFALAMGVPVPDARIRKPRDQTRRRDRDAIVELRSDTIRREVVIIEVARGCRGKGNAAA